MKVFVDTSAFIARFHSRDQRHKDAMDYLSEIQSGRFDVVKLYTSDYVIDETVTTIFARTASFELTRECGETLIGSRAIERLQVDQSTFSEAWEFFKARGSIGLSFTDATSAILMRRRGIESIFTFDGHFTKLGIITVP